MTPQELSQTGLLPTDLMLDKEAPWLNIFDHLPLVVDFVPTTQLLPPDSFDVLIGNLQSGTLPDLFFSDDQRLELDPTFSQFRYQLLCTIDGTSPVNKPSELQFSLESSTFSLVGTVGQRVELFNYDTQQFELIDLRTATPSDSVINVTLTGNLSRFVEAGTGAMQARIRLENELPFWVFDFFSLYLPFDTRIDQAIWTLTP